MGRRKKKTKAAPKPTSRWPAIRAAILSFFVVFNVLAAIPSPGWVTHHKLSTPTNQAELKRWVGILGDLGIQTEPRELAEWYVGFAGSWMRARGWLLTPIDAWMRWTMTSQGWRLFGMPDERPFALSIVAKTPSGDRLLYQSGDFDHEWQAGKLQFRRVRALFNPGNLHAPSTYTAFAKNIAREAFDEVPEATHVVITLLQFRTTLPGEPPDDSAKPRYVKTFSRKDVE